MTNLTFHIITNEKEIDILSGKKSSLNGFDYQYRENDETITLLKKNFHLQDSLYLIVRQDDTFAAFVSMDRGWWVESCFFLREIFVNPDFQGQGLGKKLMNACIEHARKHWAIAIVTETAFENIPMQKLCESLGFERWDNPEWKEGITYKLYFK